MHRKFSAHLELTKFYWKKHLSAEDMAIDATCGNGHDTLFLAQLPCKSVLGVDIQPEAIENTKKILEKHGVADRVSLRCCSHENLHALNISLAPKLIVYNLGYLPKGNKNFTTQTESTLSSLLSATTLLKDEGAISITCYPGHSEGEKEEKAIVSWAQSLPYKQWLVCHHRWLNRERSATVLWIKRT